MSRAYFSLPNNTLTSKHQKKVKLPQRYIDAWCELDWFIRDQSIPDS